MKPLPRFVICLILVSFLGGCMPGAIPSASKKSFQSNLAREAKPQVSAEEQNALAQGNTAFALDLYHALGAGPENSFYSPYSISLALAMTYAGARGDTEREMADALHFTLPQDRLHPAMNAVDQELATRKEIAGQGSDGKGFRLNLVNDIWGEQDYTFLPAYLDLLAKNYGAGLRGMDFKNNPDAARKTINDYIADKTEQRIKDLIPAGAIDAMTRLVLTNAIYFNAAWLHPFNENATQDAPFTRLDGSTTTVKMMYVGGERFSYAAGDGYQVVALPYENSALSMVLLVPDTGKFSDFEAGLDAARLETILAGMRSTQVNVGLPKFKVESQFQLGQTLAGMGMKNAFDPFTADFSGMDGTKELFIGDVVHKAFVKVDEAGTEAAAATAVIMRAGAARGDEPIQLTIDRPFILLIRDEPTQSILFIGRIVNPVQ
jgi:serpin B